MWSYIHILTILVFFIKTAFPVRSYFLFSVCSENIFISSGFIYIAVNLYYKYYKPAYMLQIHISRYLWIFLHMYIFSPYINISAYITVYVLYMPCICIFPYVPVRISAISKPVFIHILLYIFIYAHSYIAVYSCICRILMYLYIFAYIYHIYPNIKVFQCVWRYFLM